jgi:hypothetical protein
VKKPGSLFILVLGLALGVSHPLSAHHGTGISYDLNAPLKTIKGVVTEFAWRNPHVSVFVDVKDEQGNVVNWGIEHSNVNSLARQGYSRNSLKPGQEVTVIVYPSRSGAPVGLMYKVILADGKEILQRNQAGAPQRGN